MLESAVLSEPSVRGALKISSWESGWLILEIHMRGNCLLPSFFDARDGFLVMHRRPVDADEIAVGKVARLFPFPHPATAGAIGTATFRVGVETVGTGGYDYQALGQPSAQSSRPWRAARLRVNTSPGS